ncbi:MAG TPA: ABC transporter substrate-binding protein [Rectinemataceae bacterium]|nr:ABC transporter substrate-binding protein [Rectinemataceae bacterium]
MKKRTLVIVLLLALVTLMSSFAQAPKKVAVIIKATDSDFWQYVLIGATNYAKENSGKVVVTTYGPPSEADIDKQVAILEDVVNSKPDAIVIASTSSDATIPAIERAVKMGIPVITIDNKVNTKAVVSHLATNNMKGGALAADMMVARLKELKKPLTGKVALISAMAGVQVLTDRDTGFADQLKKVAPNLKVLPTRYIDNDIMKALAAAEDLLTANPDLVGFFADNNHSGDGVARAISERKLGDKIAAVAFDSDPEEVQSLKDGVLYALVLQDPYGMGYKGVQSALDAIAKKTLPAYVDTGATAVTKANMNDAKIKGLLDPMTMKK